jgi:RNA polymerase sigma factor (sigma-70 family)
LDEGSLYDSRLVDDDELVRRARDGDNAAFDELYRRHSASARSTARWITHNSDAADDIVADVFASMLSALRHGRGPQENFSAYLRASVRNRCIAHSKASGRATPTDDDEFDALAAAGPTGDTSDTSQLVATAFAALTPRWQRTLWMTEVEGRTAKDVAAELSLPVAAVPALAYRARRAFAEAYLQQHAQQTADASCRAIADKLPRYVRGSASRRDVLKVDVHLESCATCTQTVAEMSNLNMSLRTLPAPPIAALAAAGAGTVATWLATAAAIGVLVVVPVVALQGDQAPDTEGRAAATFTVPAGADSVRAVPGKFAAVPGAPDSTTDGSASPTTSQTIDTSVLAATVGATDPAATGADPSGVVPGLPDASAATTSTIPAATSASGGATVPQVPAVTLPAVTVPSVLGSIPPLLPPITVPIDVPLPVVPIDGNVSVDGSGVGVDAGAGGIGVDASVGGGGVQATVALPTLPLVGTVPPVVVDVTLPQPVTDLLDGVLGSLLGPP